MYRDWQLQLVQVYWTLFLGELWFYPSVKFSKETMTLWIQALSGDFFQSSPSITLVASQNQTCSWQIIVICQTNTTFSRILSLEGSWKACSSGGVKLKLCSCQSCWHFWVVDERQVVWRLLWINTSSLLITQGFKACNASCWVHRSKDSLTWLSSLFLLFNTASYHRSSPRWVWV